LGASRVEAGSCAAFQQALGQVGRVLLQTDGPFRDR